MTQSEYEAELHFRLCKSIFATLVIKGIIAEFAFYPVPLRKNTMHQLGNWR